MNNNNLKRRRAYGSDDDSFIVSAPQSSPPPLPFPTQLEYFSPEAQYHISSVALIYHLSPSQLHQVAFQAYHDLYLEPTNKRHRPLPEPMSSQFPGSSSVEKSQQAGQHAHHGIAVVDPGRSSSTFQDSGLPSGLTQLANIFGCCQHCLAPYAIRDGYQLIAEPNSFDYGTNTPYAVEKPPSAQIPQPEDAVPASVPLDGASSFPAGDAAMMSAYVPTYQQPLQQSPGHGMVAASSGPDDIVYPTDIPAPPFYPNTVPNVPVSDGSHGLSSASHLVATSDMLSNPYNENMMSMAPPPVLQQQPSMPVTTASFPMAAPYVRTELSVKNEDAEPSATSGRLDIVYSHQRPPASKRGPFKDVRQREQTANTRKTGSCVRCKMQRIRCVPDPDEPNGCCLTCKPKPNSNHHKQVIRQPCLRAKLTDVKCMKPGQVHGFEWTLRWGDNGPVDNIANWASPEVKTIKVTEGYTKGMSVQLHVRQFVPQQGDKLERSWVTENGVKKSVPIPPYAITDLDEAQVAYQDYIKRGVVECFTSVLKGVVGARDRLLYATYRKAWEVSQDPRTPMEERELLTQTLELWMAVRLTTKSVEIVGNETLGMDHSILDTSSPQHGSIPLPPVMGAQLDLVLIQHIQTRLRREMLEKLQKMTQQNKQKTWLTTYLVTFMLLHNIALLTHHDASYARKHGMKTKFARESDVHDYHYGGTILLAYFHYCNKGIFPFTDECRDQELRQLAQLDEQALQFVQWTRAEALAHRHEWEGLHEANQYDRPYFFISQLFQRDWQPQTWAY